MVREKNIHDLLKSTFGYNQFRGEQEAVIKTVLNKSDALVIMPTGGGKSLCYQIPALAMEGMAIVISPLIALMNDQVAALQELNISAAALHSNVEASSAQQTYQLIEQGDLDLLYVSPEKLLSQNFIYFLKEQQIALFAIDEAHCVSVWGNDFRPEYVKLSIIKSTFKDVPVIALTATADQATQKDIIAQLTLNIDQPFLSSFERTNITTIAKPGQKRIEQIVYFLRNHKKEAGIIYCLSRKSTESVASSLIRKGFHAKAYHAGLESTVRRQVQDEFQNDELDIVCATIAFGMGIDKPNIRWVIHYNMPKNIEGYYQEIGRAGRDQEPAETLLFYSWADFQNLKRFVDEGEANETFKRVQLAKLERMWQFATATSCRTNVVLNYFGEFKNERCDHCDNCSHPPKLFDGTKYTQMALSAVARTNQNLGINLLIDVLRGSYKQEVTVNQYDQIRTFGVGREVPAIHWRHFITQMINQGVLRIDFTDASKLKLTPLSMKVLKEGANIKLAKFIPPEKRKKVNIPKLHLEITDLDQGLLSKLKNWRKTLAQKQRVPAFVIFHDKTLQHIASAKPNSENELLSIDGIGPAKIKKYGDAILSLIDQH